MKFSTRSRRPKTRRVAMMFSNLAEPASNLRYEGRDKPISSASCCWVRFCSRWLIILSTRKLQARMKKSTCWTERRENAAVTEELLQTKGKKILPHQAKEMRRARAKKLDQTTKVKSTSKRKGRAGQTPEVKAVRRLSNICLTRTAMITPRVYLRSFSC